ncbi:MAG TPA: energy-dependent translational throttle protein EttA [Acidimicrobiia bacterium]|nr:energy-dependent translational throttle protein EttA [Acidimicrobiia bacterium]
MASSCLLPTLPVLPDFIYSMVRVSRHHPPDRDVLKDITLGFYYGAKIGVIGPNGAGKSSLLRIMAGLDDGYTGEARLLEGYTVGLLEQEPRLDASRDVLANVMDGVAATRALLDQYQEVMAAWADPEADFDKLGARQEALEKRIEAAGAWELDRHVAIAMDALRVPPSGAPVGTLSGGERRRVALCRLLLAHPDLLLLDEPTNHLDAESVAWLEHFLQEYTGTVIAITHDRYFLDNVAGWILELDQGRGYPFEGNYSGWLEQKRARLAQEEREESARQRTLARELEWVRMSPRARQAKGRARLTRYEELVAEAQATDKRAGRLELEIPFTRRLGEKVIEAHHLTKGYGDRLLIEDLTFSLPPAGIVGVIGPNGAGKTTLFRMITGLEEPDSGSIEMGASVDLAYVDQTRDALQADHTIYQEISGGTDVLKIGNREVNSRAYVASLNFKGSDQQKKVGTLSGGERNRVHLGKMLRTGGNVILLDEPSNDLDVDTLRALEEALIAFPGCAVVISHDRWFLDRICTHILSFEGESPVHEYAPGKVRWFEGNWSEYESFITDRYGPNALLPDRSARARFR